MPNQPVRAFAMQLPVQAFVQSITQSPAACCLQTPACASATLFAAGSSARPLLPPPPTARPVQQVQARPGAPALLSCSTGRQQPMQAGRQTLREPHRLWGR